MNLRISTLITAVCGACTLFVSSCVGPDGAYVGATAGSYGPARTYSNYTVTLADGYAGRGYYYGPPNVRYYNRQPGVVYYRTRESVPSQYWRVSSTTTSSRPGSSYRPGYRPPSSRDSDRWDNDRRDNDRWDGRRDGDRRDDDRRDGDRWDRDGRDRDGDRRGSTFFRR